MRECQPLCNLFQKLAWWLTMAVILTVPCVASSKLTISPSNPKQLSNSTLPFTATVNGELIDGPTKWTSSNTAVATIAGTTGAATATLLSAGTTTITAVHGLTTQDVNGDGKPDLVATFDTSALNLHPHATVARLTGWLKNGQSFSGEEKIRVVPSLAEDPSCRWSACIGNNPILLWGDWPIRRGEPWRMLVLTQKRHCNSIEPYFTA